MNTQLSVSEQFKLLRAEQAATRAAIIAKQENLVEFAEELERDYFIAGVSLREIVSTLEFFVIRTGVENLTIDQWRRESNGYLEELLNDLGE